QYSGGVSAIQQFREEKKDEAFQFGRKFAVDLKEKKSYPEQLEIIEQGIRFFAGIIKLRKNEWLEEYEYWAKKSWL
ncbi:MAG: hypothetical protein V2A57_03090, partial [Elusimicrobiota bacterium]